MKGVPECSVTNFNPVASHSTIYLVAGEEKMVGHVTPVHQFAKFFVLRVQLACMTDISAVYIHTHRRYVHQTVRFHPTASAAPGRGASV